MSQPDRRYFELFSNVPDMVFLETGTYRGDGIKAALDCGFRSVHSVEAVRQYQERCSKRFEKEIKEEKVKIHLGGSETVLPQLTETIAEPIVYWLDAHTHGVKADEPVSNCPLNAEIKAIATRQKTNKRAQSDVILIDDVRVLVSPEWGNRVWGQHDVDFNDLVSQIIAGFREHVLFYIDGIKPNDILAIIPADLAEKSLNIRKDVRQAASAAAAAADQPA